MVIKASETRVARRTSVNINYDFDYSKFGGERGSPSYSAICGSVKEHNGSVSPYLYEGLGAAGNCGVTAQRGFGLIRRIAGVVLRPRATFADLVHTPAWLATWLVILIVWAALGGWLLSTEVGQQALVDERVRVVEAFGGLVTDVDYAALQARPPWWVYFTSGGRALLMPLTTVVVAMLLLGVARSTRRDVSIHQAMAISVHASVALLIGQIVATPLHYVRESLTSPVNLAAILPLMEEGTMPARLFGTIDLFALWWAWLLAVGLSSLTGQRVRRYAWRIAALFLVFAAVTATATVIMGGA